MTQSKKRSIEQGFHVKVTNLVFQPSVELFGHVTLVEGYAIPDYIGCYALVAL